jgi:hypothetical protein
LLLLRILTDFREEVHMSCLVLHGVLKHERSAQVDGLEGFVIGVVSLLGILLECLMSEKVLMGR